MSEPECGSALAQHLRTRDDVLGLSLFGGGGAATTPSSAKITTTLYKISRATKNMPNPCTQRKGSERRAGAEDVALLTYVLMKRNCDCELRRLLRCSCSCAIRWIRCDSYHYPAAAAAVFHRLAQVGTSLSSGSKRAFGVQRGIPLPHARPSQYLHRRAA
jgi:hypothetical protein